MLNQLVPALRARGLRVEVQSGWVEDLVDLFNSATVYLYDSADYWRGRGVSEGFGLPPIEALACGCVVFSSLNHALADLMDPGVVGHQIGFGSLEADVERIAAAVGEPLGWRPADQQLAALIQACSEGALVACWQRVLAGLEQHWLRWLTPGASVPLRSASAASIRWGQRVERFQAAVQRGRRLLGWGRSVD